MENKYLKINSKENKKIIKEFNELLSKTLEEIKKGNFPTKLWQDIVTYYSLTIDFIEDYKDYIPWKILCKYQNFQDFPDNFINEYKNYIDFEEITKYQELSDKFLEDNFEQLKPYLDNITKYQKLSKNFINKHFKELKLYINNIVINQNVSDTFIIENKENLNWNEIIKQKKLSEEVIRNTRKYIFNSLLLPETLKYQEIPIDLLTPRNFVEKLLTINSYKDDIYENPNDITSLLKYQNLPPEFIEEHFDKFKPYIKDTLQYQLLSDKFIEKLIKENFNEIKPYLKDIIINQNLNEEFIWNNKEIFKPYISEIIQYQNLKFSFMDFLENEKFLSNNELQQHLKDFFTYQKIPSYYEENVLSNPKYQSFFEEISKYQKLSEASIEKYFLKKPYIKNIIQTQELSEQFLEKHYDKLKPYINNILQYQNLSNNFLEQHQLKDKYNLLSIEHNVGPTNSVIYIKKDKPNSIYIDNKEYDIKQAKYIIKKTFLPKKYINNILNSIDKCNINKNKHLQLELGKVYDDIDWKSIDIYDEQFKFKLHEIKIPPEVIDKIDFPIEYFPILIETQQVSEEFIEKNYDKYLKYFEKENKEHIKYLNHHNIPIRDIDTRPAVTMEDIIQKQSLSEKFIEKHNLYQDKLGKSFPYILYYQNLSDKFLKKHNISKEDIKEGLYPLFYEVDDRPLHVIHNVSKNNNHIGIFKNDPNRQDGKFKIYVGNNKFRNKKEAVEYIKNEYLDPTEQKEYIKSLDKCLKEADKKLNKNINKNNNDIDR